MTKYNARSCQLVWFIGDTQPLSAEVLLNDVLGLPVDTFQRNKLPTATAPFSSQATSIGEHYTFEFTVAPGRVDLVVTATSSRETPEQEMALLDVRQVFPIIQAELREGGLAHLSSAYRIAVVVSYLEKVQSLQEAQSKFMQFVGMPEQDGVISDLMFQMNRRFRIEQVGVNVNRLIQLRTEILKLFEMQPIAVSLLGQMQGREVSEEVFFGMLVDVNSVPEEPLKCEPAVLSAALRKMMDEAIAIRSLNNLGEFR